ncbi:nicotinate-nucleotide---dimethylbenzimidazole phosphoribosyltransferase [Chytriomyces confervae]|uniref:Nicotinate-nucleotide--dimethylbenzimidazole phosphoribosyltransferase n=1 Tax=Chytriomyces confervae TaxID=246404 RepID=A0A507D6M7_9FUNG|nr:nicotinate-nucleotide---dimethylbenzimidazole phosphoribosyltransferase [Chytriomyces confervae]
MSAEEQTLDDEWLSKAQAEIDAKTKPLGSLGLLEAASVRLVVLQRTLKPRVRDGAIALFAADHGLADDGGAAINVICAANNLVLRVIDVGVDTDETFTNVLVDKVLSPNGTLSSFTQDAAMTPDQLDAAIEAGRKQASIMLLDADAFGIGELGIGNTAVASILLAAASGNSAAEVTGKGTGVEGERYTHKVSIVSQVLEKHADIIAKNDWKLTLQTLGGLEISAMVGACVETARTPGKALMIDGFISTVAFLYALKMYPNEVRALVEGAASIGKPLLDLGLRLGEGTGAALAFPLLKAAAHVATDMNTFAGAGVSESN